MHDDREDPAGPMRRGALLIGALALAWGLTLGVRPVAAFGLAQLGLLALLWVYPRLAARRVTLTRRLQPRASEDDDVACSFLLASAGRLPLLAPEVLDRFGPDRASARRAVVHPLLAGGEALEVGYLARCTTRRGLHPVGPARVRVTCPTGLFACERDGLAPATLLVYPRLEPLPTLPASGSGGDLHPGARALRRPGQGELTLSVREHRPGDSLRQVHWPTLARRGRLAVIERERPVARSVVIVVDLARAALRGLGGQSSLEVSVRVAAAAAAHYLGRGDRVALHARGAAELALPPAGGQGQLVQVLEALARVRPDGETPLTEVAGERLAALSPGDTAFLVVADPRPLEALVELALGVRARGGALVAVLLDPATFPGLWEGAFRGPPAELSDLARALSDAGAVVYRLGAGEPLSSAFLTPAPAGRRRLWVAPGAGRSSRGPDG